VGKLVDHAVGHSIVTTWYRPPGSDTRLFDDFQNFLSRCDLENKELLLIGDLNCDLLTRVDCNFFHSSTSLSS
jgi:hypothetical protein